MEQEGGSVVIQGSGSMALQEREEAVGLHEQEEEKSVEKKQEHIETPRVNLEEKIRKNLEMFEATIKQPDVAKSLSCYDNFPERRLSYKLMYEQLEVEVVSLKDVIEKGTEVNINMKAIGMYHLWICKLYDSNGEICNFLCVLPCII